MIKTIIFDLDGTLLNTIDDICDSVNASLEHFNYPTRTLAEVKSFVGNGAKRLMELCVPDGISEPAFNEILPFYLEHYKGNLQNKTAPYDGILDMLAVLYKDGYQLGILSNKPESGVKELNEQYFSNYIKHAFGECADVAKKPAKDGVLRAIKEIGCELNDVIYVGDSEVDVLTAKNSGVPCIAVTWGFRTKKELLEHNPAYHVDTPSEIIDILRSIKRELSSSK